MYIKYTVNWLSISLYHDIHARVKLVYFEQFLVARGGILS